MANLTEEFKKIPVDFELWQRFYNKHQQSYIRARLNAIKLLWLNHSRYEICKSGDLQYVVLTRWLKMFINPEIDTQRLAKGTKVEELSATYKALFNLTQPIERDRLGFLTREQEAELKTIITTKQPNEVGFDCYIWTAKVISAYVKREFNVDYKPISIYDVLERLHLSHQRAHEDYSNADKEEQKEFIENLKKKKKPQQQMRK